MPWIDDIVESTPTSSFFINCRIDMADFVNPHKVVVQRNAFSAFPNTWNEAESKGGAESEKLRCQFSQMDRDMNYKRFSNGFPFQKKKH